MFSLNRIDLYNQFMQLSFEIICVYNIPIEIDVSHLFFLALTYFYNLLQ
jgi:hypothetical protein